ncbi:type IV toxin-antitoxin system AbiEi family antitoxin domain-containing protein [Arthrobacter sp. H20]|uniref:type IV toxin-antitoxin system AbiEi family antitoxin domain-containing protein n=1 Tax=Arthrobacter sp. H20 TaxID=1267981 RepID=UPI000685FAA9|nr:type IV toxin-antitoxin system AbiEi family antitoxin domain-containing protein [Arthrobacter sp. H20]
MDLLSLLTMRGGVTRRGDLVANGVSSHQLAAALAAGQVVKPCRGVYCLPGADPSHVAAACAGAELACISGASHRGLWILRRPALIHVSVDHGRALDDTFTVHRSARSLTDLDVCIQCMRCLPELDALCIVESAVVLGKVSLPELRQRATGRRDLALRKIIAQIDPFSQSILETVAKYHLRRAGYSFQSQVYVKGVGRLDLVVEKVLGVEADGREHHSASADFEEDRRRGNLLMIGRVPVLRATYSLLVRHSGQFLQLVKQALDAYAPTDQG